MNRRLLAIAWPAFLVAAAMEMVLFAFVDPMRLHGLDGELLGASRSGVYTVVFFALWLGTIAATALTLMLAFPPRPDDVR